MDTDKHGWGKTQRRRERGEAQSKEFSATLCGLCASAFNFLSVCIRVNPWLKLPAFTWRKNGVVIAA